MKLSGLNLIRNLDAKRLFKIKARNIHGNLYSYGKVKYFRNWQEVAIYCKKCREYFNQRPDKHLMGHGCQKCGFAKNNLNVINKAKNDFVAKARKIHGDAYDYSKVNYITARKKIEIYCRYHKVYF